MQRRAGSQHNTSERRRLAYSLLVSVLVHATVLTLTFDGAGLLPNFALPWHDRRIEASDMRVVVLPPQSVGGERTVSSIEPLQQISPAARVDRPHSLSIRKLAGSPPSAPAAAAKEALASQATGAAVGSDDTPAQAPPPLVLDRSADTAPVPMRAPPVITLTRTDVDTWVLPEISAAPTPNMLPAPSIAIRGSAITSSRDLRDTRDAGIDHKASQAAGETSEPAAPQTAGQQEVTKTATEQQDAAQHEAPGVDDAGRTAELEQQAVARAEAERKELERKELERKELERKDAERKDAERRDAERRDAERKDAERRDAERKDSERQDAERKDAERKDIERRDAERKDSEHKDAERKEAAARREAALRAIGRELEEAAARREAASRALPSSSSTRRYRLWGQSDPNAELLHYALTWARKIEANMTFDIVRDAAKQPHRDPVVIVAVRSDGSVESVTFEVSSGVPALDDAIRRVVDSQVPYRPFPASLARDYDVIEIRRTWYFDVAIRLY